MKPGTSLPSSILRGYSALLAVFTSVIAIGSSFAAGAGIPRAAAVVRAESLRSNNDPGGKPLPLVAQWHMGHMPLEFQIGLLKRGHHLLPFIPCPTPERERPDTPAFEESLALLSAWNMPIAVIGTQWEAVLTDHEKKWRSMPPEQSALVWSAAATTDTVKPTLKMLSPFGAIPPWEEAGRYWTDSPAMKRLQQLYPRPPLVLMVSNNEASRLRWHDVDLDKRYVEAHGTDKSDDFKRKVLNEGWIERYRALFKGMRDGLASDAWRSNIRFVGYNSFGPSNFGRGADWKRWATTTEETVSWNWHAWDGAIPEAYDNHWQRDKSAFAVWSPQTEKFNSVFMKAEALRVNPNFWLEIVFWDGHSTPLGKNAAANSTVEKDKYRQYEQWGVKYTPEVYRGWVQYAMWTVQPRVAREWRGSGDHPRDNWWPHFREIIRAVDLVHADATLTKFWRQGSLVPNRAHPHPFGDDIPEKWRNADRWFALDTSADPPRPWTLKTQIPLMALAHVMGAAGQREWLLYAHAPMGERKDVEVAIPNYQEVKVAVSVGGSFYHVKETDGSVTPVGDLSTVAEAPVELPGK